MKFFRPSVKEDDAISAAKRYAAEWGVPWGNVFKITKRRVRRFPCAIYGYTFFFETGCGSGMAEVSGSELRIDRFEFHPNNDEHFMIPLWGAFPGYDSLTGWRQGYSEGYKDRWLEWYRKLSEENRLRYKLRFPPPEDEKLCWRGFYENIADVNAERDTIPDPMLGGVPE